MLAWWTAWDIMQTWLPPSELPFAEQVLVQNVSHENHLIFMEMTVQVAYIFILIVCTKTCFATEAKVNLGLGYSSMSCSGSLWSLADVLPLFISFSSEDMMPPSKKTQVNVRGHVHLYTESQPLCARIDLICWCILFSQYRSYNGTQEIWFFVLFLSRV